MCRTQRFSKQVLEVTENTDSRDIEHKRLLNRSPGVSSLKDLLE